MGPAGSTGSSGVVGATGSSGIAGPQGTAGKNNYIYFYEIMHTNYKRM